MNVFCRRLLPTPRLLVVGSVVLGVACSSAPPASAPAPKPTPTPTPVPRETPPPASTAITGSSSLIRAMHDRYAASWYRNLTRVRKTTVTLSSGTQVVQTWYEAIDLPGKLRLDTDLKTRAGVLYVGDSTYNFTAGKLVKADTGTNELLLLGFDVYAQPSSRTETRLRRLGFDLAKFHEGVWRGVPVYVVGAARGDTTSRQFWVDRDRMVVVRLLENTRQGRADYRFNSYQQSGGGWVPSEVEQYVNGKRRLLEEYSEIHTNGFLAESIFDPAKWATAPHWVR